MEDFFRDSPWLSIPEDRRGDIIIKPFYPPGRLLGGSPSGQDGPPKSKLAALAAARKKKENGNSTSKGTNSSVALLDKLETKLQTTRIKYQPSQPHDAEMQMVSTSLGPPAKKYPSNKRQALEPGEMQNMNAKKPQPSPVPEVQATPIIVPAPVACPSDFAQTLFGASAAPPSNPTSTQSSMFYPAYMQKDTENDPFAGPSPDDVVTKAQTSKGSAHPVG